VLQAALRENISTINDTLGFSLCGIDLRTGDPSTGATWMEALGLKSEIFFVQGSGGSTNGITWDSAPTFDYDEVDDDNDSTSWSGDWNQVGGKLYNSSGAQVSDQGSTDVGNFVSHLLAAYKHSRYFGQGVSHLTIGTRFAYSSGIDVKYSQITIDYANLPSTTPLFTINEETFNKRTPNIDRKVVFRNSENTNTVYDIIEDPTKIGKAGTFGSLKRFITLIDENQYWDSIMPLVETSDVVDLSSFTPVAYSTNPSPGMGWILDSVTKKDASQFQVSEVKVKLDNQNPSQYNSTNTTAYDYSMVVEGSTDTVTFPQVATINTVVYDHYKVTNYLQRDFRGLRDFTRYTLRNLLFGFGDGPSGRITIRPSLSIWKNYDNSTKAVNSNWSNELIVDPIRGFRFGLLGYDEKPRYIFSQKHFGFVSDMFEQSLDTKTSGFESNPAVLGSPVVINPINPVNPEISKLIENTQRYNKTTNATITKPYIEDNYEATPNPTNLKSEKLRVDVAGSIRTKAILAPGNTAANIRRRG